MHQSNGENAMNIRVIYHSITGNTKKIAVAIAEALKTKAIPLQSFDSNGTFDLLIIGSSIHKGEVHSSVKQFISGIDPKKIKQAAVFCTGFESKAAKIMASLLRNKGIHVADKYFSCKGRFLFFNLGHPNAEDFENVKKFAKSLAK